MPSLRTTAGFGLLAAYLGVVGGVRPGPRSVPLSERLQRLPSGGLPLKEPVEIRWNDHQVPFIEARHDEDLAVALGVVHAHLRLAQMEIMRRVAHGRLAEAIGPAAVNLDHVLRILNLGRPVPDIIRGLPDETRIWLERFAAGINHAIARMRDLPEEFSILAIKPTAWSVSELLTVSRLAATDFTWRVWIGLLRLRGRPDWVKLWQRMMSDNAVPVPSFAGSGTPRLDNLAWLLDAFGRTGSNSVAVSRLRSATGAALLASDPHLSIVLPNLWLMAGYRSPSYHVVGLMIPGVPAMALGRNPWIGWGGTSLHAASSELFDVTDLPEHEIRERRETIAVRWWRDETVTVRETAFGPVISDAPLLRAPVGKRLALHWIGHTPSDEITSLLRLNRARSWRGFHEALDGLAIPAMNMTYADAEGRVGLAMAAKLPRRPLGVPPDMIVAREARRHWESFVTAKDLPSSLDPPSGFVASANNRPDPTPVPVGFFFSPDDRVKRLSMLLAANEQVSIDDLAALQQDVRMLSAIELRDALLGIAAQAHGGPGRDEGRADFFEILKGWDGCYDAQSPGALAFELLVYHFTHALHGEEDLAIYAASWDPWALLREDIATIDRDRLGRAIGPALDRAAGGFRRYGRWGEVHRLRLSHILGTAPVIGRRYRFADVSTGGSNETVMKTAHGFSAGRHAVRFGANARHISDFSDPDANFFVLLGGQDGWLGSSTFLDQFALWRRGAYVQLPLRPETVRARFRHRTELTPQ